MSADSRVVNVRRIGVVVARICGVETVFIVCIPKAGP